MGLKYVLICKPDICDNKNEIPFNGYFFPSFAAQSWFAPLSYLTESPKRNQKRMGVSVNNKTESTRLKEKHGRYM